MRFQKGLVFPLLLMCCGLASAKKKVLLPADVLQARTVLVVIDPDAGTSIDDPNANRIAVDNVERAIEKWGRFTLAMDISNADLVIVVRKGSGRLVEPTIGGLPNSNSPGIGRPGQGSPSMGGNPEDPSVGSPRGPSMGGGPGSPGPPNQSYPQMEAGQSKDMMTVYRGKRDDALDNPPVWRYSAKDALESPSVPAVDAFRKLIAETEKQQAKNP
ncbi:MAG TPA: hypothetical protein VFW25_10120 [Silvibacterium sp.]|nr:hypothetical protein [Silvibacterium sp.]